MPINNVNLEHDVTVLYPDLVNLYGCSIGAGTRVGPFVEIQKNSVIGAKCKISSHSFICEGVTIEDEVFIGHGVMFTNGLYPRATMESGELQRDGDWELTLTRVGRRASIGSNATILAGIVIGTGAMVGAGAVVTKDVPDHAIMAGNPARIIGDARLREKQIARAANTGEPGPQRSAGEVQ
jgi:UDP-2-acetamido-3-amino-2,3-dideoxy-glucuronate N-acetyltransferase